MHSLIRGSFFIIATGMISGCCSSMDAKPGAPAATRIDRPADANTCVMQAGGAKVLRLTMSLDTKCTDGDGFLKLKSPQFEIEVWLVPGAKTVDEAIGQLNKQIESEFKDFKPHTTSDLTIAGSAAKRLAGKGHEADDGDDGDADIIVFKVAGHVFVACTHDERLNPPARRDCSLWCRRSRRPRSCSKTSFVNSF